MKKNILIVIVVILLMAISAGATYLVMNNNKEECPTCDVSKTEENITDGVKLTNIKENGDTITEVFSITLNGKTKTLLVKFTYSESDDGSAQTILGEYNKVNLTGGFVLGKYNEEDDSYFNFYRKEEIFNTYIVKENLNESNFQIIKGTDNKNYLLINTIDYKSPYDGLLTETYFYSDLFILNEDLEFIDYKNQNDCPNSGYSINIYNNSTSFEFENNINPWYEDQFGACFYNTYETCEIRTKIEDNKLYHLAAPSNGNIYDDESNYLEERVYTINNNKLEYEVINKYKITSIAGAVC